MKIGDFRTWHCSEVMKQRHFGTERGAQNVPPQYAKLSKVDSLPLYHGGGPVADPRTAMVKLTRLGNISKSALRF